MRSILAAGLIIAATSPVLSLPMSDYPEYHGTWSLNCKAPASDKCR
jgi:invasion protein IalB